jgi:hypothetical protein
MTGRRTGRALRAAALACALTAPAAALKGEEPLSAIDWLSRSVTTPGRAPAESTPTPPVAGLPIDAVEVVPLDALLRDAAGVRSPQEAGLPSDLWGTSRAGDLAALIGAERLEVVPALRSVFEAMLTAALDPPVGAGHGEAFLLARIDKLLAMGALAPAEALIAAAGEPSAELFRRRFDIALLLGTEDAACEALRATPGIAPTYPALIFCLVRGGDWDAAALTLDTGRALGAIGDEDDALLRRFLDPELAENTETLAPPERPTPLSLRIFEAIGEPIPTSGLPIAFAHADLRQTAGWKARIEAAERLARAGAIGAEVLHALYDERRAAASGGVWDRVRMVQRLAAALEAGDVPAVAAMLPDAWATFQAAELELPLALRFAGPANALPLTGPSRAVALRMAHLAGIAPGFAPETGEEAFLAGLAAGDIGGLTPPDSMGRAIAPAFGPDPAALMPQRLRVLLEEGRRGEVALHALDRIADGATGDRRGVTEGLAALRVLGLDRAARRAALELLLLDRRG